MAEYRKKQYGGALARIKEEKDYQKWRKQPMSSESAKQWAGIIARRDWR